MQIPAAGSVWLALFWALIALGFLGILVAAVSLVVMSFETSPAPNTIERRPEEIQLDAPESVTLATSSTNTASPPPVKNQADASSDELAALVNDPDISHLMRQLNSRFG
jgi:cytoskeletal protein RodZ